MTPKKLISKMAEIVYAFSFKTCKTLKTTK